ncbi:type II toxin-antitoxin system RelE/ParE family toxin [Thiocystis violacea]|uniref:type II toxin-antitoxin system RelE/ParE family toxin n=1 Tax=Thiocystis violacea TaxID=13725 RepID=UPI0019041323|nr:type II toxin-antitoxin system RelE/ParE family toxin [Thiocystis violacea]MBK1724620.1 addiction module toxin RelE [Thiocystis violacea]
MRLAAISFAESALDDLAGIREWHATQGVPEVGDRLVAEVFQRVEALADHPDLGRMVPEFGQPFLRELIHPPFRIVYRRDPLQVRVVRVWRSERLLRLPASAKPQDPAD